LAWKWDKGQAKLHSTQSAPAILEMTAEGNLDAKSTINWIDPSEAYRTLGIHISLAGGNKVALKILNDTALSYCSHVTGSTLSR
jgi:hypothetical protein